MKNDYSNSASSTKPRPDKVLVNYNIRCAYVTVVGEPNCSRVMKASDAIAEAEARGLDLVQISFDKASHRGVCKIIDYGKFKYEQSKREKEAKKQSRANAAEVKTVQFSIMTDDADRDRQVEKAKKFIADGDVVKLTIRFRNRRESANLNYAKDIMKKLLSNFDGIAQLDSAPALSGRELSCMLRKAKNGGK